MSKKLKVTIVVAVVLCVVLVIVVLATQLGGGGNGGNGGNGGGGGSADLGVYAITVSPAQPQSLQSWQNFFSLNVDICNYGQAISGEFGVNIMIKDVSREEYYVCTQHNEGPMNPGENRRVYSSTNRAVNYPGNHEVIVDISPYNWEDADPSDNTKYYNFYVN